MTHHQLKLALAKANLTDLARRSGVPRRTLRRIKNGHVTTVLSSTIERIESHITKEKAHAH